MKRAIVAAAASVLMATSFSASADDKDGKYKNGKYKNRTITEIVLKSGGDFDSNKYDYDILLNAVLAAGLEGALADPKADLTVFAPNDKAFIRLARDLGMKGYSEEEAFNTIVAALTALGDGDPIPVLTNILLYHVSPDAKYLYEVVYSGGVDTLLEGATILPAKFKLLDNEPDLQDAYLWKRKSDIKASNGIIHTISRVMIPIDIPNTDDATLPTIADIVASSGGEFDKNKWDYDLLLNALIAANLVDVFTNPDDSFTVLAPNDRAFIKTARELGYHGWDEAGAFNFIVGALTELGDGDPIPLLTAVLVYHVIGEEQTNKQILESETVTTLGGTIHPNPKKRTLGDNDPNLTDPTIHVYKNANIRASNGFIQTITRVLIPVDLGSL